jgi:hypothetical protein
LIAFGVRPIRCATSAAGISDAARASSTADHGKSGPGLILPAHDGDGVSEAVCQSMPVVSISPWAEMEPPKEWWSRRQSSVWL